VTKGKADEPKIDKKLLDRITDTFLSYNPKKKRAKKRKRS